MRIIALFPDFVFSLSFEISTYSFPTPIIDTSITYTITVDRPSRVALPIHQANMGLLDKLKGKKKGDSSHEGKF